MSQLGPLILAGLNQGSDAFTRAAGTALAVDENSRRRRLLARQLGQDIAAQQAYGALYDQLVPAPQQFLETVGQAAPIPNPAYPQQVEQRNIAGDAISRVTGSLRDAGNAPGPYDAPAEQQDFQQSPFGQGVGRLSNLLPPEPQPTVQGQAPVTLTQNPEYDRYSQQRDAFRGAPAEVQQDILRGHADFYRQAREDARWAKIREEMLNEGYTEDDYKHARMAHELSRGGLSSHETDQILGGTPGSDVYQELFSPDPAIRAQGAADYTRMMHRPPPASVMPRPGSAGLVDPNERLAKWNELETAIGKEHFDPALYPVLREKFLSGQKVGDTLWSKALPGDKTGKGFTKALQVEYEDAVKEHTAAESRLRNANNMGQTEDLPALTALVNETAQKKQQALEAYTKHLRSAPAPAMAAPAAAPSAKGLVDPKAIKAASEKAEFGKAAAPLSKDDAFKQAYAELGEDADPDLVAARVAKLMGINK